MRLRATDNFLSIHHRESLFAKRLFLFLWGKVALAWAYCEHVKAPARQPHSKKQYHNHVHALRGGRPRP